jgi:hypothetical protein
MSAIGTGTAAAVAQTALTAQQVARRRDKDRSSSTGEARRICEMVELHMLALDEGDDAETTSQLHIDGELPQHQSPPPQPPPQDQAHQQAKDDAPSAQVQAGDPPQQTGRTDPPLYQHLDIQA